VGGHIERGEKPLPAAKRELREEMGYAARRWVRLGEFVTDSNRGGARAHLYLALDAHRVGEPRSDDLEEQHLLTLSRRELEDALLGGQFKGLSWTTAVAMALQYLCAHRRHRIALRR
jgi:ADP-ribose pyrophosphatase